MQNGLIICLQRRRPKLNTHLIDFVFSDDVIEHDPQSAQQVDDLHWTQLIDRDVSRTVVNIRRSKTGVSLQWTGRRRYTSYFVVDSSKI